MVSYGVTCGIDDIQEIVHEQVDMNGFTWIQVPQNLWFASAALHQVFCFGRSVLFSLLFHAGMKFVDAKWLRHSRTVNQAQQATCAQHLWFYQSICPTHQSVVVTLASFLGPVGWRIKGQRGNALNGHSEFHLCKQHRNTITSQCILCSSWNNRARSIISTTTQTWGSHKRKWAEKVLTRVLQGDSLKIHVVWTAGCHIPSISGQIHPQKQELPRFVDQGLIMTDPCYSFGHGSCEPHNLGRTDMKAKLKSTCSDEHLLHIQRTILYIQSLCIWNIWKYWKENQDFASTPFLKERWHRLSGDEIHGATPHNEANAAT